MGPVEESGSRVGLDMLKLLGFVCKEFDVSVPRLTNKYSRGKASTARHVFVLVATELGYSQDDIEFVLKMNESFASQTIRRKYNLKQTVEYIHVLGLALSHGLSRKDKDNGRNPYQRIVTG